MLYDSEARNLRIALGGDFMLTRRLAVYQEERFLKLRALLHEADAVFANFESTAHYYSEGSPTDSEGTYMTTEPSLLDDLKWFGIDIVSCANNHAFDFGEEGVVANHRHLEAAGIPHAGTGRNLREAQSPAYVDTPGGRVAVVSATATFKEWSRAGAQRPDFRGRPGLNALGFKTEYVVDERALKELRRIGEHVGLEAESARKRNFGFFSASEAGGSASEREYNFFGKRFVLGDTFGVRTKVNQRDMAANLAQIREARRQADWVIFSLHSHEMGGETFLKALVRSEMDEPAEFVKVFAHACIDEGADIFAGHGPHLPLGVEIYKQKPIFYSLGDFVLENETVRVFPAHPYERFGLDDNATPADFLDTRSENSTKAHPGDPAYWESIVGVCEFTSGQLAGVTLHPIDLGHGRPRPQRGRPLLADAVVGEKILSNMARMSSNLGTRVDLVDGRGIVALS